MIMAEETCDIGKVQYQVLMAHPAEYIDADDIRPVIEQILVLFWREDANAAGVE